MLKLIGGFIGTLVAKLLAYFAIKRAGEKEQQSKDLKAANQEDRDARKIEDRVNRMDDTDLDHVLESRLYCHKPDT